MFLDHEKSKISFRMKEFEIVTGILKLVGFEVVSIDLEGLLFFGFG